MPVLKELKKRMIDCDITQQYLAKKLGRCGEYMSLRVNGKRSFEVDEAYQLCDLLHIPQEEFFAYFPRGGKSRVQ